MVFVERAWFSAWFCHFIVVYRVFFGLVFRWRWVETGVETCHQVKEIGLRPTMKRMLDYFDRPLWVGGSHRRSPNESISSEALFPVDDDRTPFDCSSRDRQIFM